MAQGHRGLLNGTSLWPFGTLHLECQLAADCCVGLQHGQPLCAPPHSGYTPGAPSVQVNVSWQLGTVTPATGGFCCVPGSHKGWPMPGDRFTSIDLPQIQPVTMAAGDVLLFLGSALTHGAFAWEGEAPRRCAIFFFHSSSTALPAGVAGAAHPRL